MADYYEILGVSKTATADEIKAAYRKLVKIYHPDAMGQDSNDVFFKQIQEAYDTLINPEKRREYDNREQRQKAEEDQFKTNVEDAINTAFQEGFKRGQQQQSVQQEPIIYQTYNQPPKPRKKNGCLIALLIALLIVILVIFGIYIFMLAGITIFSAVSANSSQKVSTTTELVTATYVTSIDQIPESTLTTLKEQAVNVFYATTNWTMEETVENVQYDGLFLITHKNGAYEDKSVNNSCYIILKITASNKITSNFEYYYYVAFNNLMIDNEGIISVNTSEYTVPDGEYNFGKLKGAAFKVDDGSNWYIGYQKLNDLFFYEIQNNLVEYDYTSTYSQNELYSEQEVNTEDDDDGSEGDSEEE